MDDDEAFGTFDWAQKIVPQEYREAQSKYFGKSAMSILVGSFVWKDPLPSLATAANTTTTTTSLSPPNYSAESYIVALNHITQTELGSLSAGEIVTK